MSANGNNQPPEDSGKPILTIHVTLTEKDRILLGLPGPPLTPYDKALIIGVLARAVSEANGMPLVKQDPTAVATPTPFEMSQLLGKRDLRGGLGK